MSGLSFASERSDHLKARLQEVLDSASHFEEIIKERGGSYLELGRLEIPSDLNSLRAKELKVLLRDARSWVKSLRTEVLSCEGGMEARSAYSYAEDVDKLQDAEWVLKAGQLNFDHIKDIITCHANATNAKRDALAQLQEYEEEWPDNYDINAAMESLNSYLKGEGKELFKTWVVALIFSSRQFDEEVLSLGTLATLSDSQIQVFAKISKPEVLIRVDYTGSMPPTFKNMAILGRDHYFKVPTAALPYFDIGDEYDFLEVEGLSEIDIETIATLHGGAAYATFEAAKAAALNLR